MYDEFTVVRLSNDLPQEGLVKGTIGTIVFVYKVTPPQYEVEFFDENGKTLAVVTVIEKDLEAN